MKNQWNCLWSVQIRRKTNLRLILTTTKKNLSRTLLHETLVRVLISIFLRLELVIYPLLVEWDLQTSGLALVKPHPKYMCQSNHVKQSNNIYIYYIYNIYIYIYNTKSNKYTVKVFVTSYIFLSFRTFVLDQNNCNNFLY